jgi:hypothetical protein
MKSLDQSEGTETTKDRPADSSVVASVAASNITMKSLEDGDQQETESASKRATPSVNSANTGDFSMASLPSMNSAPDSIQVTTNDDNVSVMSEVEMNMDDNDLISLEDQEGPQPSVTPQKLQDDKASAKDDESAITESANVEKLKIQARQDSATPEQKNAQDSKETPEPNPPSEQDKSSSDTSSTSSEEPLVTKVTPSTKKAASDRDESDSENEEQVFEEEEDESEATKQEPEEEEDEESDREEDDSSEEPNDPNNQNQDRQGDAISTVTGDSSRKRDRDDVEEEEVVACLTNNPNQAHAGSLDTNGMEVDTELPMTKNDEDTWSFQEEGITLSRFIGTFPVQLTAPLWRTKTPGGIVINIHLIFDRWYSKTYKKKPGNEDPHAIFSFEVILRYYLSYMIHHTTHSDCSIQWLHHFLLSSDDSSARNKGAIDLYKDWGSYWFGQGKMGYRWKNINWLAVLHLPHATPYFQQIWELPKHRTTKKRWNAHASDTAAKKFFHGAQAFDTPGVGIQFLQHFTTWFKSGIPEYEQRIKFGPNAKIDKVVLRNLWYFCTLDYLELDDNNTYEEFHASTLSFASPMALWLQHHSHTKVFNGVTAPMNNWIFARPSQSNDGTSDED